MDFDCAARFQILTVLLNALKTFLGINIVDRLDFIIKPYNEIGIFVNMAAIAMFFSYSESKAEL